MVIVQRHLQHHPGLGAPLSRARLHERRPLEPRRWIPPRGDGDPAGFGDGRGVLPLQEQESPGPQWQGGAVPVHAEAVRRVGLHRDQGQGQVTRVDSRAVRAQVEGVNEKMKSWIVFYLLKNGCAAS